MKILGICLMLPLAIISVYMWADFVIHFMKFEQLGTSRRLVRYVAITAIMIPNVLFVIGGIIFICVRWLS